MLAMTLATLGWGTWWLAMLLRTVADWSFGMTIPSTISILFAIAGLGVVLRAVALLRADADVRETFARVCRIRFMEINTFALLVMVVLVADRMA